MSSSTRPVRSAGWSRAKRWATRAPRSCPTSSAGPSPSVVTTSATSVAPELTEILEPVVPADPAPRGLAPHRAEPPQELPGADVEDPVAPGVHEGQDRRGRGHAHAPEPGEELEALRLAARRQDRARHATDRGGRVRLAVTDRP